MTNENDKIRLAVAESRLDSHQQAIENNQELTAKLVDRLDVHIQNSNRRDQELQDNFTQVTVAVTQLTTTVSHTNETLNKLAEMAEQNQVSLIEWRTTLKTLSKVGGIVVLVLSAGWTVFTYAIDHSDKIRVEVTK